MVFQTLLNVNYVSNSVFVDVLELVPGPVDFFSLNQLCVGKNVVFSTELETLLGRFDTSDEGASDGFSLENKRKLVHSMVFSNQSKLNKGSVCSQKADVVLKLMLSSNSVYNKVHLVSILVHRFIVS